MKIFIAIIAGLLFSVFMIVFAMVISGAGHGWNGALWFSFLTLVTCPMVAVALTGKTDTNSVLAILALVIGIIVDFRIIFSIQEEYSYFIKITWLAIPWILLMLSWQFASILVLVRNGVILDKNKL